MSARVHALIIAALLAVVALLAPTRFDISDRDVYTKVGRQWIVYDCADLHCPRALIAWTLEHLPGPSLPKWKVYAVLANAGAAIALAQLCLTLGLSARASVLAMWTYALGFGTLYTLFDCYSSDPLMFLLGPYLTDQLLRGRIRTATVVAAAGVFAKEFAAAPLGIVAIWAAFERRTALAARAFLAASTVVLFWLLFRLGLTILFNYKLGQSSSVDFFGGGYIRLWVHELSPRLIATALFLEYGALYLLLPCAWPRLPRVLRGLMFAAVPALLALMYLQQPDRALWNVHFLVIPAAVLVLEPMPVWFTALFLAAFGLANARLAAQLTIAPPAAFSLLLAVALAAAAGVAAWRRGAPAAFDGSVPAA